jgi:hypothetical protein
MGLIDEALARQAAAPAPRRIDYDRMNKVLPRQRAELTRAKNALAQASAGLANWERNDSPVVARAQEKLAAIIKRHVTIWNEIGAWPDQWSTWQVALDDALGWPHHIDIADL